MTPSEEEIKRLGEGIQNQLKKDWNKFRNQHHNPSNKGASYEEALSDFLDKYYGGVYETQTETVVIDENLNVFESFDTARGEHEIDLVGIFQSARPRIIFEVGEMTYVPLIGTAFLCEVKNKIDSGRLEKDLKKLQKVSRLAREEDRSHAVAQTGKYTTDSLIKCLVYDENSISDERLEELLMKYEDSWDLLLLVQDDILLVNSTLPIFNDIQGPLDIVAEGVDLDEMSIGIDDMDESEIDQEVMEKAEDNLRRAIQRSRSFSMLTNGLSWFLILLTASISRPLGVDTAETLRNILEKYEELQ
jgi:hypothetical protein